MKLFHRHCHTGDLPIKSTLFSLLLLTALVAPAAAAPVTWDLIDVTFSFGGGATGWITFDASSPLHGGITDWNITAVQPFSSPPIFPTVVTVLSQQCKR